MFLGGLQHLSPHDPSFDARGLLNWIDFDVSQFPGKDERRSSAGQTSVPGGLDGHSKMVLAGELHPQTISRAVLATRIIAGRCTTLRFQARRASS